MYSCHAYLTAKAVYHGHSMWQLSGISRGVLRVRFEGIQLISVNMFYNATSILLDKNAILKLQNC